MFYLLSSTDRFESTFDFKKYFGDPNICFVFNYCALDADACLWTRLELEQNPGPCLHFICYPPQIGLGAKLWMQSLDTFPQLFWDFVVL